MKNLVNTVSGARLSDVVIQPRSDAFLSPGLYKVAFQTYLQLSPFHPGTLEKVQSNFFVSGVAWAASDGAARRAFLMEVEADDGDAQVVPPDFLPASVTSRGYEAIMVGLKLGKPRVCQETAAYRIATDGLFIHRVLETEDRAFFFRKAADAMDDPPYAALLKSRRI